MHSEFFIKFQEHIKLLNSYIRAIELQLILLKNIKGSTVIRIGELNQPFYLNNPFFHSENIDLHFVIDRTKNFIWEFTQVSF